MNLSSKINDIGIDFLSESPESLCQSNSSRPRFCKNEAYAAAIQQVWKEELLETQKETVTATKNLPHNYQCTEEDGSTSSLYGHIHVPITQVDDSMFQKNPGVVLFHTGAGPHDIFLHWKANYLAANMGYTVLIADMISDDVGWAWSDDRSKYESAREHILQVKDGKRINLRKRITASLSTLKELPSVDENRIGAIGWCFGGQVALEIVNMKNDVQGLQALATFHGVFDGVESIQTSGLKSSREDENENLIEQLPRVLICNGEKDPFVPENDKVLFQKVLERHDWEWIDYKNCLHGFSNPAQATNPNPKFEYNEIAAKESWKSVCRFLRETMDQ